MRSFLIGLALLPAMSAHAQDWTTYQGNAQHDGYVPVSLTQKLSYAWHDSSIGAARGVVTLDGMVFATSDKYAATQSLVALDLKTGTRLWGADLGYQTYVAPPATGAGKVYVRTTDYADYSPFSGYEAATGKLAFTTPLYSSSTSISPMSYSGGNVYLNTSHHGVLHSVNATTGASNGWSFVGGLGDLAPSVWGDYLVTYASNQLQIVDSRDLWNKKTITTPYTQYYGAAIAAISGDRAYVADWNTSRLISFDLVAGEVDWMYQGGWRNNVGPLAVAGSELFAIIDDELTSFDALTGVVNWKWAAEPRWSGDATYLGQILVTDNTIFVSGYRTYILDRATHELVSTLSDSGQMAWADGYLLIANSNGVVAYAAAAVPEASSGAMLALGLGLAGLTMRRRAGAQPKNQ